MVEIVASSEPRRRISSPLVNSSSDSYTPNMVGLASVVEAVVNPNTLNTGLSSRLSVVTEVGVPDLPEVPPTTALNVSNSVVLIVSGTNTVVTVSASASWVDVNTVPVAPLVACVTVSSTVNDESLASLWTIVYAAVVDVVTFWLTSNCASWAPLVTLLFSVKTLPKKPVGVILLINE